jgi:hypothetical protein
MNMKLPLGAAFLAMICSLAIADEDSNRAAVIQAVDDFFAAMTSKDIDALRVMLMPDGVIYGYRESVDRPQITSRTHAAYLDGLAAMEGTPVERFWDPQVMIHGRLATVWTPYDFHIDGNFSHCGVNNFSMLRTETGWRITGVVFSIEVAGCEASPLGLPGGNQ